MTKTPWSTTGSASTARRRWAAASARSSNGAAARAPGEVGAGHRKLRNRDVDWLIDREVQKIETYSGIDGINNQDHAVQESMGPIVDRTRENLGTTDAAVIATRRILLARLKAAAPDGDPPGVAPTYYGGARDRARGRRGRRLADRAEGPVSAPGGGVGGRGARPRSPSVMPGEGRVSTSFSSERVRP